MKRHTSKRTEVYAIQKTQNKETKLEHTNMKEGGKIKLLITTLAEEKYTYETILYVKQKLQTHTHETHTKKITWATFNKLQ